METQAEYTTRETPAPFAGFAPPTENYSRMPHQLVEALPLIETLAEMKVILYVLRHTWGYQDDEKRISLDEFCNGRKHSKRYRERHPDAPERLDGGTGMSVNAIKDGIKRAVAHGFLIVDEDASDKARIERYYSLSELDCQKLTPDRQSLTPGVSEVDTRTWKETSDRNSKKEEPPTAPPPDADLFSPPPEPTPRDADPVAAFKARHNAVEVMVGKEAEQKRATVERPDFTDPRHDADPWDCVVAEFCTRFLPGVTVDSLTDKKRDSWRRKIEALAREALNGKATPARAVQVMEPFAALEKWLVTPTTTPYKSSWAEGFQVMLVADPSEIREYAQRGQGNGGASTPRGQVGANGYRVMPR